MARPKSTPKLCHHSASGRAVVRIDGKDYYCGAWDIRRDRPTPEANAAYHRLIADWLTGVDNQPQSIETIGDLIAAYMPAVRTTYRKFGKETGEVGAQKSALRFLAAVRNLPISEFGPLRLKAIRANMISAGLYRESINRHIGRIRQAFAWAAENELIDAQHPARLNCVRGLRIGQGGVESPEQEPLEWSQVEVVKPYVSAAIWAMVCLQWHTGMRSGELVQMTGRMLDMRGRSWFYRPTRFKTQHHNKKRIIALGPQARKILEPWLRIDPDEPLFQPCESELIRNKTRKQQRQTPQWPSHDPELRRRRRGRGRNRLPGKQYKKDSYRTAIQRGIFQYVLELWSADHDTDSHLSPGLRAFMTRVQREHGRKARKGEINTWVKARGGWRARYNQIFLAKLDAAMWHPHQLRHSFATQARAEFEELDPVRAALGHSSASTTEIYAKLEMAKAAKVAERIG